jgi:hypothetical protein
MSVQPAVIGLADQRIHRTHLLVPGLADRVADHRIHARADAQRVGEHDRRLDRAELVHLRRSGELAERVANEHRAGDLLLKDVAAMGNDRRDAGAHAVAVDDRRVPHAHPVDVCDRVQQTGRMDARRDAQVACPRACLGAEGSDDACENQCDGEKEEKPCRHGRPTLSVIDVASWTVKATVPMDARVAGSWVLG